MKIPDHLLSCTYTPEDLLRLAHQWSAYAHAQPEHRTGESGAWVKDSLREDRKGFASQVCGNATSHFPIHLPHDEDQWATILQDVHCEKGIGELGERKIYVRTFLRGDPHGRHVYFYVTGNTLAFDSCKKMMASRRGY